MNTRSASVTFQILTAICFIFTAPTLTKAESNKEIAQEKEGNNFNPGDTFRDCEVCPEMIVIPPGKFMMGSATGSWDEKPIHEVTIDKSFAVGIYEITFSEWENCVEAGECLAELKDKGWGRGKRPAMNVSWAGAQTFVRWIKNKTGKAYRLLSESEWEYVARAGTTTEYSFGETVNNENANFAAKIGQTKPVGSYPPNAFGVYDMHGNVWEWVSDCWRKNYKGAPTDGSAWIGDSKCRERVLRGGSWLNSASNLRVAFRYWSFIDYEFDNYGYGLRVARSR